MRTTHLLAVAVDRPAFEAALPAGFALSWDEPLTGFRRTWNWRRGDERVALSHDVASGCATVVIVDAPDVEAHLARTLGFVSEDEAFEGLRTARDARAKCRALWRFGWVLVGLEERPDAVALATAAFLDPEPVVRWTAVQALGRLGWPGLLAATEASAARYAEMEGAAERRRRFARHQAEQAAEAARQATAEARAERLEALLDDDPAAVLDALADEAPAEAWRWRSRAWEALDRPTSAWIALYTSIGLDQGEYDDDDPADHDDAEDVELPDSGLGEPAEGVLAVLGAAFDALHDKLKWATVGAILDGLKGRTKSPLLRFARALAHALDHEHSDAAAKLVAEFGGEPDAHWIHARSVYGSRERAEAYERLAEAHLGTVSGRKQLTDAERAWVAARIAVYTSDRGVQDALANAASDFAEARVWEAVLRVTARGLAIEPRSTALLRHRAVALTMLRRHDEAVAAYGEAIAAADAAWGPEPHGKPDARWLLYFNRACEHALAGRRDAAFADLRHAVRFDAAAGPKALKDEYFAALRDDPALHAAAYGIDTVDREALERDLRRALGTFFHGDRDEAVRLGQRALAQARVLGDPVLLAKSLRVAGNAATYTESPARGIALLTEAVAASNVAWPDDPGERAEAEHLLGAAHHAAGDWEAADAAYRRAEALRRVAGGDDAPALAISYGDRARLAASRNAPVDEVLALTRAGGELCARVTAAADARGDADAAREALDHATVLWSNGAVSAADAGRWPDVVELLTHAVDVFEALLARDGVVQPPVLATTVRTVQRLFHADVDGSTDAVGLRMRLLAVEEPDPAARDELWWWSGVRGAAQLEARRRPAAEVAAGFHAALRGSPPAWFTEHPSLASFVAEIPRRLPNPGDLVLVTMAMSMATDADALDRSLADLQGIAVAHRQAQAEG